jgi:hypothetical protein
MTDDPLPADGWVGERRDPSPRNQRRRSLGSWLARYAWRVVLATAGLAGALTFSIARGVLAAPGRLNTLEVKVDTVAAVQERQGNELKEVSEATWAMVAMNCLGLNDSAFVMNRLPCGKAFTRSGVTQRLAR